MTIGKRRAPRWRGLFLRALERTGNVRAAVRAAGVDHSLAYYQRRRDAAFAAAWEAALDAAQARAEAALPGGPAEVGGCPGLAHPHAPAPMDAELVVRRSKRHGVQLVKAGKGRWSARAEAIFLAHLRATGCVRRAAAGAGFSANAVHNRRHRYPAFAAAWDAAQEEAVARLRSLVIGAGIATFDPDETLPAADAAGAEAGATLRVTVAEAIAILRLKGPAGGRAAGAGRMGLPSVAEPSIEQVRDDVLARLAAIRRQRDSGA